MTSDGRRRLVGEAIPFLVWAAMSVRLFSFSEEYAATILVQDQWDFLSGFFDGEGALERFRHQHGPHRQGLAGWLLGPVLAAGNWDGVAIALATAACLVLAALVALLLARRLSGRLDVWDAAIPVLLLGLGQSQTLVGVANPAHSALPLLLVLSCAWVLTLADLRLRLAALLLLDGLAVHTGFALFLAVVLPGVLVLELARRGGRAERPALVVAVLLSLLVLASFFVGWDPAKATSGCQVGESLTAASGWGLPFGRVVGTGHGGFGRLLSFPLLLAVAGVAWLAARRALRSDARPASALVVSLLAGFSLLFVASVVAGRSCLGERALYASRYATLAAPGLLAIFWSSRAAARLPLRGARWLPALLCLALLAAEARPKPQELESVQSTLRRRVAFAVCMVDRDELPACARELGWPPHPDPASARLVERLAALRLHSRNVFGDPGRSRLERRAVR